MIDLLKDTFLKWCDEQELKIPKVIGKYITTEDAAGTEFKLDSINFAKMSATYRPTETEDEM